MRALLMLPVMLLFLASASAQTTDKEAKTKQATKAEMSSTEEGKEHVCTKACTEGKHAYACGEKGHECAAECKGHAQKEHVCTKACADGDHAYACGEKGHECSEACAKKHKEAKHKGHKHDATGKEMK